MAHEVAHADRRHSTENMTKAYGFSILLGVVLGNNASKLEEIAADLAQGLGALAFSRKHEYEADEYAVRYTSETKYHPKGVAGFFEKLESSSGTPEFLSTHPSPDNRVESIDEVWQGIGSPDRDNAESEYATFLNLFN
jgi:predicted Zn-dependent protease